MSKLFWQGQDIFSSVEINHCLPDDSYLTEVTSSARLNQGDVRCQAHPRRKVSQLELLKCEMEPVDMVPSLPVVQGIEAEPEALEEVDPILWLHDVIPIRLQEKRLI